MLLIPGCILTLNSKMRKKHHATPVAPTACLRAGPRLPEEWPLLRNAHIPAGTADPRDKPLEL